MTFTLHNLSKIVNISIILKYIQTDQKVLRS